MGTGDIMLGGGGGDFVMHHHPIQQGLHATETRLSSGSCDSLGCEDLPPYISS